MQLCAQNHLPSYLHATVAAQAQELYDHKNIHTCTTFINPGDYTRPHLHTMCRACHYTGLAGCLLVPATGTAKIQDDLNCKGR